ncbi:hypothetical protein [Mesonia aquimarina]|uniref:hypothetical protein n=1 Tax=Mesonia aquimarina TaxID=1504967 RepID=UPI000EF57626|nr:hypothetical protein [Mesonia aquimarina]
MIKKLIVIAVLLCSVIGNAQEIISSPYSYFGIGLPKFKGTAENRMMGGLSILSDSIHVNLQNPAGYGALKLTTYSLGVTHNRKTVETDQASDKINTTSLDYLAIGIPAGKLGFGLGIVPYTSVGYDLMEDTAESNSQYSGQGGLNKLYLAAGYRITENFRVGVEGSYNFGNIQNENILFQSGIQYGTKEENRSDLSGFTVKFGAQYEQEISEKLQLTGSVGYRPSSTIVSENNRTLSSVISGNNNNVIDVVVQDVNVGDTDLKLPAQLRVGAGIGEKRHWFAGIEYQQLKSSEYSNRSFAIDNVNFEDAATYRLGGFYIPDYNDITSYFNRIVFRAGFRYQETGITLNNEEINEFGISFGAGLPVGNLFSNVNIGVEYGSRGTKSSSLVEENFLSIFMSLSFNDKWFQERKFN